jgi:ATP-dependent helicase/nuclease subunit A
MNPSERHPAHALWCDPAEGLIGRISRLLVERRLHAARTVVLVPYGQLIKTASSLWAAHGAPGFAPRFETTRNWARSAGGFAPGVDDIAFDTARDLLTAQSLLARAGFAASRIALAGRLVEIALQLAPLAAAEHPDERAAWALQARGIVEAGKGSEWFDVESALNGVALAWAANSGYATDVLFAERVRAQVDQLIVLDGLQSDPLIRKLCVLFGDRVAHLGLATAQAPACMAALHPAADPEDEAERAAACVLHHLAEGRAPLALVATDRALTRRISAQLVAQGVSLHDETGWKLSTTRAGATLMSALRACAHDASSDQVLDWLKSADALDALALRALEARLRERGMREWRSWCVYAAASEKPQDLELLAFTDAVEAQRATLARARPLGDWLKDTRALLEAAGQWAALAADVVGIEVIAALYLDADEGELRGARCTLAEFTGWVRDVLEAASFVLAPRSEDEGPQVVVLPLHQLLGRAFAAVVVPGCDDQRLPASPEPPGDWNPAQRAALSLPSREMLEAAQRAAWAGALQAPCCDLLWRQFDASGEPVRPSPLVQMLHLDHAAAGAGDPRRPVQVAARPTPRPQPHGDALVPATLSSTAYEDLRRCPYRFFALRQLGLRSSDELDAEVDKRDFGNWLHAVLGHFHEALKDAPTTDVEARRALMADAQERATREFGLSEAEFLPFAAAWPAVREGYLDWLAGHEASEGAVFVESEPWKEVALGRVKLVGRLDRVDATPDGRAFVIDYKTESADKTRERVKDPTEDTQLAFYAALFPDDSLRAAYVNVGEKASGTRTVEQPEVVAARDALVAGVMDDLARIADGAALPALGEGSVCEFCTARGLCRKDFWSDEAPRLAASCASSSPEGEARPPRAAPAAAEIPALERADPAYEHNGAHVTRERFYAIACDPRRSVAVEACAGAGKTWMLVSRIVRALLEEGEGACAPHEILAITFTKKAAGEMRERLDQWLEAFAQRPVAALVPELVMRGMDRAEAEAKAPRLQGLYRTLLAGGRPVQFRTFHAWFAGLLRSAPVAVLERLRLPADYQLLEDDAEARVRVWRPFLAAVASHPEASADYHALVAAHGRSQAAKALDDALTRRVEFALADAHDAVDEAVTPMGAMFPAYAGAASPDAVLLDDPASRAALLAAARALGRASAPTFSQKGVELETAVTESRAAGVLDALLTQKGEPRKFSEKLAGLAEVRAAQQRAQQYCAARAQHEAWLHQQRMARLTRLLLVCFAEVKAAHGWVDMNDVEQAAHLLLAHAELWGWVQERLDARVRHLLIDEFQDTNPLQWQALHGWLDSYAGAVGRRPGVFIVGDPKQSIYRFRRAEPQVFIAAQAFVQQGLDGDILHCDHTHRNAPAVMDLVNAAMQEAQQAGEFSGFRAHTTESRGAGRVRQLPPIARDALAADADADAGEADDAHGMLAWRDSLVTPRVLPEERLLQKECEQAARWIAQRIAGGLAPSQIMVLARRRSRLTVLQDELRKLHIAVQQPEKNELNDAPEVQDMVALLDVLVSPDHDLSLARALKSPLWSLDDDALVQLALRQRARPASWFDLLQTEDLPAPLAGIGPRLRQWQQWLAALPPHDALSAIYHDADVLARFAAAAPAALRAGVLANLRGLVAASLEIDGARFATPYALVRLLRGGGVRAPSVAAADAVQLLTVHGAKGLEAELVLLLDTDASAQRAQTMGVLVKWPGAAAAPERFVFLASEKNPPACTVDDLAEEHAARHREEINALYVATTRARTELVVSAVNAARPNAQSWWSRLAPRSEPVDDVAQAAPDALAPAPAAFEMLRLPAAPARATPLDERAPPPTGTRASALGQAMHRLLEWAQPGAPLPAVHVRAAAREFALDMGAARTAALMAQRIRAGEGAWAWDAAALDWHGNEVTLVQEGQTLRIDRLVRHRDSAAWWVFDYKSAGRPERDADLIAQLERYRDAVQSAYPGETVRAAFLTGQGELVTLG